MAIRRADFPLPDVGDALTAPFFASAAEGRLAIPRCVACALWCWYPEEACPACGGELRWQSTSGRARLFSWAIVRRPFLPAFAEMVPFVTALVALDEDPSVRIPTYIVDVAVDAAEESLAADLALEAVFRPLRFPTVPDREVIVPMFRPLKAPSEIGP